MRAAVRTAPRRIEVVERPQPRDREGWVPVRIRQVGVCGGDLRYFQNSGPVHAGNTAYVVCHEAVGVTPDGQRVVIDPLLVCESCAECRAGRSQYCAQRRDMGYGADGLASEVVQVPWHRLHPVPDHMSDAEAAVAHPLAAVVHAVDRVVVRAGQRAIVLGPGPAGLLFALLLGSRGLDVTLAGRPSARLDLAASLGLGTLDVAAAAGDVPTPLDGFDLAVEATGAEAVQALAPALVRPGGTLLLYSPGSFTLDVNVVFRRELHLVGSSGAPPPTIPQALQLIARGTVPVRRLISDVFPLEEIQRAFELASAPPDRRSDFVKALVTVAR